MAGKQTFIIGSRPEGYSGNQRVEKPDGTIEYMPYSRAEQLLENGQKLDRRQRQNSSGYVYFVRAMTPAEIAAELAKRDAAVAEAERKEKLRQERGDEQMREQNRRLREQQAAEAAKPVGPEPFRFGEEPGMAAVQRAYDHASRSLGELVNVAVQAKDKITGQSASRTLYGTLERDAAAGHWVGNVKIDPETGLPTAARHGKVQVTDGGDLTVTQKITDNVSISATTNIPQTQTAGAAEVGKVLIDSPLGDMARNMSDLDARALPKE